MAWESACSAVHAMVQTRQHINTCGSPTMAYPTWPQSRIGAREQLTQWPSETGSDNQNVGVGELQQPRLLCSPVSP